MRVKEKSSFLSFLKTVFIDVDNPDGEEMDIGNSNDPKMQELKDSLNRVDGIERDFYISSSSNPNGGKSNNIVETVAIDPKVVKAMAESSDKKQKASTKEQSEREM